MDVGFGTVQKFCDEVGFSLRCSQDVSHMIFNSEDSVNVR